MSRKPSPIPIPHKIPVSNGQEPTPIFSYMEEEMNFRNYRLIVRTAGEQVDRALQVMRRPWFPALVAQSRRERAATDKVVSKYTGIQDIRGGK